MTRSQEFAKPGPLVGAVTLLLFLMALVYTAVPALAAGDNIRVLSSQSEVRFPGDVVLNLEVEGEADIVEVRLYYRVLPSNIWTYTYPDLTPSRRVETSLNLNVSGIGYLPPGTELQYYYSITDSLGEVLETRRETFVYVDQRFQWETTDAGPLTIFWYDLSSRQVERVAVEVEESLRQIGELLQIDLDTPMRGIIYNSRSEAGEALPYQSQTITREQIFQGFAFPERSVFVGVGLQPSLIVHETAHLLLDQAVPAPAVSVPAWLNEGFASYVESGSRGFRGRADPAVMPLRRMSSVPGTPSAIRYFYRKSESVVGYLLETHGTANFRGFLGHLNEMKDADDALFSAYGFDLEGLDQRWSSEPGPDRNDDAPGGGTSFVGLGTVLIAVIVLVVLAATMSGYIVRRMRRKAEGPDSDRLTRDEWEGRP